MTEFVDLEIFVTQLKRVGFHIRDLGLLESALVRPQTSLFGEDAYPTLELKAAVMVESIILNHPMVDGNKRSSWLALNLFVEMNDFEIIATQDEVFDYVLDVANKRIDSEQSADWIKNHLRKL
ncbi:MAG TPA: type II toxin-antitoxin system death-on-curing family toxin [Microbacteriaceae bacterium]